jgi:hypothetical protein
MEDKGKGTGKANGKDTDKGTGKDKGYAGGKGKGADRHGTRKDSGKNAGKDTTKGMEPQPPLPPPPQPPLPAPRPAATGATWRRLRRMALQELLDVPEKYEILDVPDEARVFSSKLHDFGKVWNKSRLESDIAWAPGPSFRNHGPDEYIVLDVGAPRNICGVVISGCACCVAHASQVRLSVSLHGDPQEASAWIERGDHDCCEGYPSPGGRKHYDVLEIDPTFAQFVKINPRQWRDGENHAALRCAVLVAKRELVVTLGFNDDSITATNLAGEVILEKAFSDDTTLAAIKSSVKAITNHDGPVKLISAQGDLLD